MKILLIRQDKLGDLLVTTPVFESIKCKLPNCHLTVWAQPQYLEALKHNPWIDEYAEVEEKPKGKAVIQLTRRMRKGRYDMVIFLRRRGGAHIAASFLAGIRRRVGSITKPSRFLLTKNLGRDGLETFEHETEFCYEICELALGALSRAKMQAPTDAANEESAASILKRHGVFGEYFVVHPCTGGTSNEWYPASYGAVAKQLNEETGLVPLFTGAPSERDKVSACLKQCPMGVNLAGETDLLTLAVILRNARLMITANTGAMHLGATQQTPTVMVEMTPDVNQRWRKWRPWMTPALLVGSQTPCEGCDGGFCHRNSDACKDQITPEAVMAAAQKLLTDDPKPFTLPA